MTNSFGATIVKFGAERIDRLLYESAWLIEISLKNIKVCCGHVQYTQIQLEHTIIQ